MLTKRYLASVKNLPDIFAQITRGTAPDNFNIEHLKGIGFTSSNDRAVIPLLKDLGFLTESGTPTDRYHAYRAGQPQNKVTMGQALLDAYQDIFHVNANPTEADRDAIKGKFKSVHNTTDRVAEQQADNLLCLAQNGRLKGRARARRWLIAAKEDGADQAAARRQVRGRRRRQKGEEGRLCSQPRVQDRGVSAGHEGHRGLQRDLQVSAGEYPCPLISIPCAIGCSAP